MNSLLATTLLLLAITTNNEVFAFAPSSKPLARHQSKSLSLSPSDISFLIADAADAVANVASTAVDAVTSSDPTDTVTSAVEEAATSFAPTYSKASYYTTLGLYALSFPGLWSQIKRSTKAKVKRKTYVR